MNVVRELAVLVCATLLSTSFLAAASAPSEGTSGIFENAISRVAPNTDGTHASLSGNQPNGICYVWEQAEAFSLGVSVSTFGTNTKGIATDAPGAWTYNTLYDQCSADMGSILDIWMPGENAVMIYEVFNDQSTSWRNYTMIFEDQMEGDGSTNFGNYNAQNMLTPINDPYLISYDGMNCVIGIAPQTTGFEVASLFDGYGVWKSTAGPITQANQGTFLGDAVLDAGVWKYTDVSVTMDTWYAVRVKWDGGTYPFYAPRYSYGMSGDLYAFYHPPHGPTVSNLAASPNPHNGNTSSEYVLISASVSDTDFDTLTAEYRIDGGTWMAFPQSGISPLYVAMQYYFPNGFTEGAHTYTVRGFDGYEYGSLVTSSFTITDSTPPVASWILTPPSTSYVSSPLNFMISYEDFTAYNPNVAYSYLEWRVNNGTWNRCAWVNQSFAWGSYTNVLSYMLPGSMFAMGDWVDYRGYVRDTAATPNTRTLAQGSVWFWLPSYVYIPVNAGWNLISLPANLSGSPETVLCDWNGDTLWSVMKWYDPTDHMDPWKSYRIGGTANDLLNIDCTMGLWVYVTEVGYDSTFILDGALPPSTTIQLHAGWNLVGYPSLTNETVGNALWGSGADCVGACNLSAPGLVMEVGPTYVMQPGHGYWVHVAADSVWTVDW